MDLPRCTPSNFDSWSMVLKLRRGKSCSWQKRGTSRLNHLLKRQLCTLTHAHFSPVRGQHWRQFTFYPCPAYNRTVNTSLSLFLSSRLCISPLYCVLYSRYTFYVTFMSPSPRVTVNRASCLPHVHLICLLRSTSDQWIYDPNTQTNTQSWMIIKIHWTFSFVLCTANHIESK